MSREEKGNFCWSIFFISTMVIIMIIGFKAMDGISTYCRYEFTDHNNETGIADNCLKKEMYCRLQDGTIVAARSFKYVCYEE